MEYLLLGAFVIGLLLFVLSWLRVVVAGFRHHFITGIVSAFPVLNLLVLPSLWHRVSRWVLAGIVGLLVAAGSWYVGADKHVYRYTHNTGSSTPTQSAEGLDLGNSNAAQNIPAAPAISGKALPKSALYSMSYKEVEAASLRQYVGDYARLTRIDRKRLEGKVLGADDTGVVLELRVDGNIVQQKINLNDIIQSELMQKQ